MEPIIESWRARIGAGSASKTLLRLRGTGSKDFFGEKLEGEIFDTREFTGIVEYEPSELVLTVRCGTPLSLIERTLAEHDQFLAFEPPRFGNDPSIGGLVASGLSGPRRATAGALRDFVLGAQLIDGRGELLNFGGKVMKNVAGFDVSRLLCGSLGTLGVITQLSLKVLPRPRDEITLAFEFDAAAAIDRFNRWAGQPLPISATSWRDGRAHVRLSGARSAVRAAQATLGGELICAEQAERSWRSLRDQSDAFFRPGQGRLWRLSLPSTTPIAAFAGPQWIEWGGALRWWLSDAAPTDVRAAAEKHGGSAIAWHGDRNPPMFHPLPKATIDLHRRLKLQFDPCGIFNRGRLLDGI